MVNYKLQISNKGSSLLEILLYIALLTIIIFPISYFLPAISEARIKNIAISEVDQQGLQYSRLLTQTIRNADAVNSPAEGASANQLSLKTELSNPTIFNLENNILEVSENGITTALTSPQIIASDLIFFNYSAPETPGIIRFQFTLSYKNNLGRKEYEYSKNFVGSGTLR